MWQFETIYGSSMPCVEGNRICYHGKKPQFLAKCATFDAYQCKV